jgi:uncharacterized linocin/CFP29 family protein
MDFLRHSIAPVTDVAWQYLSREARAVLEANMSARRFVDVVGPKGFECSSVNEGKLVHVERTTEDGVQFGVRDVRPLVEVRVPFVLDTWQLDDLSRGAPDVDTAALTQACHKLSRFEDRAVCLGFSQGAIKGIVAESTHEPIPLGSDPARYPDAVAKALVALTDAGVVGPFAMALGPKWYRTVTAELSPYPPRETIKQIIDGPVLYSSVLQGGMLVSLRGGDFELTIGLDPSIGYTSHEGQTVHLFLTETFTFRVFGPEAAVVLAGGT